AFAVEHVLVRQRHAAERTLGAALGDGRIGGLGRGQRLVLFQGDDAVGELVAGLEAVDGGLRRLDARNFLVADRLGQRPGGEGGKVGHGLASCASTRRKSSTSALIGSSRAILSAVRDSSAACALAAARRSGGMSR